MRADTEETNTRSESVFKKLLTPNIHHIFFIFSMRQKSPVPRRTSLTLTTDNNGMLSVYPRMIFGIKFRLNKKTCVPI